MKRGHRLTDAARHATAALPAVTLHENNLINRILRTSPSQAHRIHIAARHPISNKLVPIMIHGNNIISHTIAAHILIPLIPPAVPLPPAITLRPIQPQRAREAEPRVIMLRPVRRRGPRRHVVIPIAGELHAHTHGARARAIHAAAPASLPRDGPVAIPPPRRPGPHPRGGNHHLRLPAARPEHAAPPARRRRARGRLRAPRGLPLPRAARREAARRDDDAPPPARRGRHGAGGAEAVLQDRDRGAERDGSSTVPGAAVAAARVPATAGLRGHPAPGHADAGAAGVRAGAGVAHAAAFGGGVVVVGGASGGEGEGEERGEKEEEEESPASCHCGGGGGGEGG